MSIDRKFGLELRDGQDIGRDPRRMTIDDLAALGHKPMGPLKALRLRCIDCSGGSAAEVRLCIAVTCPAWPFRMGVNPWRVPASEAKRERARALLTERGRLAKNLRQVRDRGETNGVRATSLPGDALAKEIPTLSGDGSEGRS
jgi:hypothetical protein